MDKYLAEVAEGMEEIICVDNTCWSKDGDTWVEDSEAETEKDVFSSLKGSVMPDDDMIWMGDLIGEETVNGVRCKH